MPIPAGERDRRIALQRDTPTRDTHGNDVSAWATLASAWAKVIYGGGMERRQAAADQASETATFCIRETSTNASVSTVDRISFDGGLWNITGIAKPERKELELTATRATPGGGT